MERMRICGCKTERLGEGVKCNKMAGSRNKEKSLSR